jgi:capsular exopolysaccharide synthesis family protein
VLTQLGRRVLLVDADLRRPRIHKSLGIENRAGLSTFLSGNSGIDELLVETDVPGLSVIPSGPIPPNPSELLGAPRLEVLLGDFLERQGFDHLIVDSPPLLSVTDSIILSSRIDATVVVVRAGATRREVLAQSAARLRQSRSNVVGAVLNAVPEGTGYGYRYYWYRRYSYASDEEGSPQSAPRRRRSHRAG